MSSFNYCVYSILINCCQSHKRGRTIRLTTLVIFILFTVRKTNSFPDLDKVWLFEDGELMKSGDYSRETTKKPTIKDNYYYTTTLYSQANRDNKAYENLESPCDKINRNVTSAEQSDANCSKAERRADNDTATILEVEGEQDTSASILNFSHSARFKSEDKLENKLDKQNNSKIVGNNIQQHRNDLIRPTTTAAPLKKTKFNSFFKNQSKKTLLTSFLPKSRRPDSSSANSSATGSGAKMHDHNTFRASYPLLPDQPQMMLFNQAGAPNLAFANANLINNFRGAPSQPRASLVDQNMAQSMDHFQRIRLEGNGAVNQRNEPPFYFASTSPRENLMQAQQQRQPAQGSMLGSTTAASLLGERAKELIGFINLSQQNGHNNNQMAAAANGMTMKRVNDSNLLGASPSNIHGLASMIKNAAEAWASSSTATDQTPTIILEHDGPTITTVDFNNNQVQPRPVALDDANESNPPAPEDEEFYNEQEGEQTESEESGEAKRIAKLRSRLPLLGSADQQYSPSMFYENEAEAHILKNELNNDPSLHDFLMQDHHQHQFDVGSNRQTQSSQYPDSINAAIRKERQQESATNNDSDNDNGKRTSRTKNNGDQLERLIKELQEINRKERGSGNSGSEISRKIKNFLNESGDLDESSKQQGTGSEDDEDDEGEQAAKLRRKLLAKLKAKARRKKEPSSESSADSFVGGEVKIPLHALLLAALDRRMSSSEKSAQTVSLPERPAELTLIESGIDGNKDRALEDFQAVSANNFTNLLTDSASYDSMLSQANEDRQNTSMEQQQQNDTHQPREVIQPSMFILNNFSGPQLPVEQFATENNKTANEDSGLDQEQQGQASTTRMPTVRQAETGDEGDFDVSKQVESFSRDQDEQLEPDWIQDRNRESGDRVGRPSRRRRIKGPVDFDDEDTEAGGESASSLLSRQKILKRRRPVLKLNEDAYERQGERFLDSVHRDTARGAAEDDVDKNTSGVEDPILSDQQETNLRRRQQQQRRHRQDEGDNEGDEARGGSRNREDFEEEEAAEEEAERGQRRNRGKLSAESKSVRTKWKPQMVDEEVSRLEKLAELRQRQRDNAAARRRRILKDQAVDEKGDDDDDDGNVDERGDSSRQDDRSAGERSEGQTMMDNGQQESRNLILSTARPTQEQLGENSAVQLTAKNNQVQFQQERSQPTYQQGTNLMVENGKLMVF